MILRETSAFWGAAFRGGTLEIAPGISVWANDLFRRSDVEAWALLDGGVIQVALEFEPCKKLAAEKNVSWQKFTALHWPRGKLPNCINHARRN